MAHIRNAHIFADVSVLNGAGYGSFASCSGCGRIYDRSKLAGHRRVCNPQGSAAPSDDSISLPDSIPLLSQANVASMGVDVTDAPHNEAGTIDSTFSVSFSWSSLSPGSLSRELSAENLPATPSDEEVRGWADVIAKDFSEPLFLCNHNWVDSMSTIMTSLMTVVCDEESSARDCIWAQVALILVPGMISAIRRFHLNKPITTLRRWAEIGRRNLPRCILYDALSIHEELRGKNLLRSCRIAQPHRGADSRPPRDRVALQKARVEKLVQEGRLSVALKALEQIPHLASAEPSRLTVEEISQKIRVLHPPGSPRDTLPPNPQAPAPTVTVDEVEDSVQHLDLGKAQGCSGWTNSLLHTLLFKPSALPARFTSKKALTSFLNLMLKGKLSRILFCQFREVLISKPTGGYRPLGLGEIFYRLCGRVVLRKKSAELAHSLSAQQPHQMAIGVSGGAEIAARLAQIALDAEDNNFIYDHDFPNAFNECGRCLMGSGCIQYFPDLFPIFEWVYGAPAPIRLSNGTIVCTSQTGSIQGDSFGMAFYVAGAQLAFTDVVEDFQEYPMWLSDLPEWVNYVRTHNGSAPIPLVIALADNLNVIAPAFLAPHIDRTLTEILWAKHGLRQDRGKCVLVPNPQCTSLSLSSGFTIEAGRKILGKGVGSKDYRVAFNDDRVHKMMVPKELFSLISADAALCLLHYCVNSRAMFFARVSEFDEASHALAILDKYVDDVLRLISDGASSTSDGTSMAGGPSPGGRVTDHLRMIRALPRNLSGLGIVRYSGMIGQCACIESRRVTARFINEYIPLLQGQLARQWPIPVVLGDYDLPPQTNSSVDEADDFGLQQLTLSDPSRYPSRQVIRQWVDDVYASQWDLIFHSLLSEGQLSLAAWFRSSRYDGSGRWLSAAIKHGPYVGAYRFGKNEFREVLKLRLLRVPFIVGGPSRLAAGIPADGFCDCSDSMTGRDALHCLSCHKRNGYWFIKRHDQLRDTVGDGLKQVGFTIRYEVPIGHPPDTAKRMDIVATNNAGELLHLDVGVTDPSKLSAAQANPSSAYVYNASSDVMESRKRRELALTTYQPSMFVPAVFESTGRPGTAIEALLNNLFPLGDPEKMQRRKNLMAKVGILCARHSAQMVLGAYRTLTYNLAAPHLHSVL
jgi:hypothetical protein